MSSKQTMSYRQLIILVAGLTVCLLPVLGYGGEQVAPRFPDMALPSLSPPQENLLSGQGVVMVTGRLLVSPCVLSEWAEHMQVQKWFSNRPQHVRLALEGCGDGQITFSTLRRGAPMLATGTWGGAWNEVFLLRLNNGVNYLTLPVRQVEGLVQLEMSYE